MPKAVDVFTPNSIPTFTYVERQGEPLEKHLANALKVKNSLVSLSGPSKSGKTVLLNKLINKDDLIYVSGAQIKTVEDLWRIVLSWMGGPISSTQTSQKSGTINGKVKADAAAGIIVAKASAGAEFGASGTLTSGDATGIAHDNLVQVAKDIADSAFVVFLDDFHYIPRDLQPEVARQLKAALEYGIRLCLASVPHRADDAVRGNAELRGRTYAVDTKYWMESELEQIALTGFRVLNVDLAPIVIKSLAREAFGSPQLMQAMCLNLCFQKGIEKDLSEHTRIGVTEKELKDSFEFTAAGTSFQSLLESLHSGPRQRGTERKEFGFTDGSKGDVYRAVLLAIQSDPGVLSINYEDMLRRVRSVCTAESPSGASITGALAQMDEIASQFAPKPIEWMDDVLDIVDPYFLFYLRASTKLQSLGG